MSPPAVAITMGDPAGIGPEVVLKACAAIVQGPASHAGDPANRDAALAEVEARQLQLLRSFADDLGFSLEKK